MLIVSGRGILIEGRMLRIARLEGDTYRLLQHPEPILEGLRKCGTRIDLFTFMQRLPETSPRFAYPMEWDNLAVLPVSTFDHWWTKQIDNKTRNMVRKAEKKGVLAREVPFNDALLHGIWQVYNECPVRQGRRFAHYGMDLQTVHKVEATHLDSSIFIGAFLGDRLIGFVKLTCDETRTEANLINILSMIQERDKAPTNALIAQAVRVCAQRGIPYLVYSNFTYRKKNPEGISHFKQNNGFEQVNIPRYYVPLTRLGAVAFRLGLHHGWANFIPQPLAAKLRDLRKAWYDHRFHHSETQAF